MKKFRKIISLLIAALMTALLLGACGASSNEKLTDNTSASGTASSDANSLQTSTAAESSVSDKPEIRLPDVQLSNKKVKVYGAGDDLEGARGDGTGVIGIMEKQYGVQFEMVGFKDWALQYTKLYTLLMSNDMPDVNEEATFPSSLCNGVTQPLDNYIDLSDSLWDATRSMIEKVKWNGKHYVAYTKPYDDSAFFAFNPVLFEKYNERSPLEYYKENTWDWNKVLEISKRMTGDTDGDGKIDQWGFCVTGTASMDYVTSQTGIPLIELNASGNGFVVNYDNAKLEAAGNFIKSLGPTGNNVTSFNQADFTEGRAAMLLDFPWFINWTGADMWKKGTIDVVPNPRWPGESTNYAVGHWNCMCICANAKNPEGAALYIEVSRYLTRNVSENDSFFNIEGFSPEAKQRIIDARKLYRTLPAIIDYSQRTLAGDGGFSDLLKGTTTTYSQVAEEYKAKAKKAIDEMMPSMPK